MAHSGRQRHRDRQPGHRQFDDHEDPADRSFVMTEAERQEIASCLRDIDEARRTLERQHSRDNRELVRLLSRSADRIFELLNELEVAQTTGTIL